MKQTKIRNIIALDVGSVRVGVARTNTLARLPQPLTTLKRGESFWDELEQLLEKEEVDDIVVGLPRNLQGDDTDQTKATKDFVTELQGHTPLPVHFQDEALTSKKAEQELAGRNKPYPKEAIDALAASYILDDYLRELV